MSSTHQSTRRIRSLLCTMYFTGIILAPTALATPAVQDLIDLRTVVNAAANTISAPDNPNRGWGGLLGAGQNVLGTANLVNNVTTTILWVKFQLDTNRTAWLTPSTNITNSTAPWTPTLPLSASLSLPSAAPTNTPALNLTKDVSTPYTDYISSIPNLSTSLMTLGRSYHSEMNAPVSTAITALQQSISNLQSGLLQAHLISSQAVIRTIRASASLEDAQTAWGRALNLPGPVSSTHGDAGGGEEGEDKSDINGAPEDDESIITSDPTDDESTISSPPNDDESAIDPIPSSQPRSRRSLLGSASHHTPGVSNPNHPHSDSELYAHNDLWVSREERRLPKKGEDPWWDLIVKFEEKQARSERRTSRRFVG